MRKKISKTIVAMLLVMAMVLTAVLPARVSKAADKPAFRVVTSSSSAKPGEEVTAQLWLEPNSNLSSFVLNYTFDTNVFEPVGRNGGVKGEIFLNADTSHAELDDDGTAVMIFVDFGENFGDVNGGLVFTLQLKVKENAAGSGNIGLDIREATVPGEDKDVSIGADDITVSQVDQNGNVNNGNVNIDIQLQSIALNKTGTIAMNRGDKESLSVSAVPANALAGKTINWTSSNSAVATVNSSGEVTAVSAGTAVITAEAGGKTASVTVQVNVPITSISLNKNALALRKGKSETLKVSYEPTDATGDKTVTWTSSNTAVATVDQNGKVTALKDGTTQIKAAIGDKEAVCELTVKEEPLTGIEIKENPLSILKNETKKLTVIYKPEDTTDDKDVTWESSDEKVAVVDKDGNVTGIKEGTAVIKAVTKDGKHEATTDVTVREIHLTGIKSADSNPKEMYKGQIHKMAVELLPENCTDDVKFNYTSSDEDVATVAADGTVRMLKAGLVRITAETKDGKHEAVWVVNVKEIPLESIVFERVISELEVGKTEQLKVLFNPDNTTDDRNITWSSSDPTVATVENGLLKALKVGKTTITAKTGEKEISFELTVVEKKNAAAGSTGAAAGKDGAVQTGDHVNIFGVLLMMILSLSVIVAVLFKRNSMTRRLRYR